MDYLVPCKTPAVPFRSISPLHFSRHGSREGMLVPVVPNFLPYRISAVQRTDSSGVKRQLTFYGMATIFYET